MAPSVTERERDTGATLPEFALVITVFVVLIAAFVDTAFVLFRHALITDSAATFTRQLATVVAREAATRGGSPDCDELIAIVLDVETEACQLLRNRSVFTAGSVHRVTFLARAGGELFPKVQVETETDVECLFCQFFSGLTPVTTQSRAMVETSKTNCITPTSSWVEYTLMSNGTCSAA